MTRREFVRNMAISLGAFGLGTAFAKSGTRDRTLREIANSRGLIYGAAATQGALSKDAQYAALFANQCGMLVTEREFKWSVVHPEPQRFDFSLADWMLDFAKSHSQLFRGHALAGNQELPNWAHSITGRKQALPVLENHIRTIVKRYAGQVHSWTVINEGIALWDKRDDGLRNTPWLKWIGPEYIELAFHTAAEADPHAQLVYNDNKLDYDIPEQNQKRKALLPLLRKWKKDGMPIHALGIQGHLKAQSDINAHLTQDFLRQVSDLGLKIFITEFDVTDQDMPTDNAERDRIVADLYQRYLAAVLQIPSVTVINTWGLSDRYTWLSSYAPRPDRTSVRPLPFDSDLQPKPAYSALVEVLASAPAR